MKFHIPPALDLAVPFDDAIHIEVRDDDGDDPCPMSVFRYYGWEGGYLVHVRACTADEVSAIALHTARKLHEEAERNQPVLAVGLAIQRMMRRF